MPFVGRNVSICIAMQVLVFVLRRGTDGLTNATPSNTDSAEIEVCRLYVQTFL